MAVKDSVRPSIIERLPRELQLDIYDLISYQDGIRLSQVNKYFHETVTHHIWSNEEKSDFIRRHENWGKHWGKELLGREGARLSPGFACFSCFKIKPMRAFTQQQSSTGCSNRTRFCLECGVANGTYRPGSSMPVSDFFPLHTSWRDRNKIPFTEVMVCGHCKSISDFWYVDVQPICQSCSLDFEAPVMDPDLNYCKEQPSFAVVRVLCRTCHTHQELKKGRGRCKHCLELMCQECFKQRRFPYTGNGGKRWCSLECKNDAHERIKLETRDRSKYSEEQLNHLRNLRRKRRSLKPIELDEDKLHRCASPMIERPTESVDNELGDGQIESMMLGDALYRLMETTTA